MMQGILARIELNFLVVLVMLATANGILTLDEMERAPDNSIHRSADAEDPLDNLVDKLLNNLFDRALKAQSVGHADLDKATLGKPGHLAISGTGVASGARIPPVHGVKGQVVPQGRLAMPPAMAQPQAGITARSPGSSIMTHATRPDLSQKHAGVVARAAAEPKVGEEYEVSQAKPIGIKWQKCQDGAIYAKELDVNADPRIQRGDKLIEVSASFGDEIWPASSYQQTMMAIKTRNGNIYMKILSRGGDMDIFDLEVEKSGFKKERSGGNYGKGTQEEQLKRYQSSKQEALDRTKLFDNGLEMFRKGDYYDAISEFVLAKDLEPPKYVGDNFERVTQIYKASAYNIACCYSKLNEMEDGLAALTDCMESGFDDYKKIREDPNLAELRQSPQFKPLMDQYDEPIFSSEAFEALGDLGKFNPFKQFR